MLTPEIVYVEYQSEEWANLISAGWDMLSLDDNNVAMLGRYVWIA